MLRIAIALLLVTTAYCPQLLAQSPGSVPPPVGNEPGLVSNNQWKDKYDANRRMIVYTFCQSQENISAPICAFKEGSCLGMEVGHCYNRELSPTKWLYKSWDSIRSYFIELVAALLGVFAIYAKSRMRALKDYLSDALDEFKPRLFSRVVYEASSINVVLLGKGGAGKTTLVRGIAAMSKASPARATVQSTLYCISSEVSRLVGKTKIMSRLVLNIQDYRGQNPETLISDRLISPRRSPTVFVLVVDLFPPVAVLQEQKPTKLPDVARIRHQLDTFTTDFLALAVEPYRQNSAGFIVFVNKADLLDLEPSRAAEVGREAYSDRVNEIHRRFPDLGDPILIVGSAATGWGISGFAERSDSSVTLMEGILKLVRRI